MDYFNRIIIFVKKYLEAISKILCVRRGELGADL
jgi:hypothetical protein